MAFAAIAEFLAVDEPAPRRDDCRNVVGHGPVKGELLQLAGRGVKHIRRDFGAVRSAIEVIEAKLETIRRPLPHAAKRMIFADDQASAWLQNASGFAVTAVQIGHPHRDMTAGKHNVECGVAEAGQVYDIGPHEFHWQAEFGGTAAADLDLLLRNIDAGHLRAEARQREHDLLITAAEYRDGFAGAVREPFQFGRMQGERGFAVASLPDPARIGAMRPGRRRGIPAAAIGLVEAVGHRDWLRSLAARLLPTAGWI